MKYPVLCIKPLYAKRIKKGIKKYEYRTYKISQPNIIYLYQAKNQTITTKIYVKQVFKDSPENIWKLTKEYSGITKKEYFSFFKNKKICYVYEIEKAEKINIKFNNMQRQVLIYIDEERLK